MPKFGPGTFEVGNSESKLQVSCLINSLTISSDKDQGDSTTKLCGTVRPGNVVYTYSLSGNVDLDSNESDGLFALSQQAKGSQLPFTFTPNDGGTESTGVVIIDPLDFGGDEFGADMTSDFEWALVGEPDYTFADSVDGFSNGSWQRLILTGDDVKPLTPVGPAVPVAAEAPSSTSSSKAKAAKAEETVAA